MRSETTHRDVGIAQNKISEIEPILKVRAGGGVIAVSPAGAALRIGVTANSKEDARSLFRAALQRWEYDLKSAGG